MANILLITSSPRGSESYSNRIADTVIRDLRNNDPDALLMVRDLAQDPLPHVDDGSITSRVQGVHLVTAKRVRRAS